ncbi:MAG: glycosyltransferase [Pseudomonadota bacterium]
MRVLAITNLFPNLLEPGRSTFNEQHLLHLAQRVSLSVIAPVAWTSPAGRKRRADRSLQPLERQLAGLVHPTFFYPPRIARASYPYCFRRSIAADFRRQLAEFAPDVVYATWIYPDALAAAQLARQAGLPVVIKAHGSDIHSLDPGARMEGARAALRLADFSIAVSQDLRKSMIGLGAEAIRTVTIYNGVDLERFQRLGQAQCREKLGIAKTEKMLLYVGNLKQVKGVDRLIAGFTQAAVRDCRLFIVGDGSELATLKEQARSAGVADRVWFAGRRPHHEIPMLMSAADLVCLLSRNEGVPNVLLEAMATGTPVLASQVGGIPEVVQEGKNGLLVDASSPDHVAAAINDILRRRWDAAKVRDSVRGLTWDRNAAETVSVLDSAISGYCRGDLDP